MIIIKLYIYIYIFFFFEIIIITIDFIKWYTIFKKYEKFLFYTFICMIIYSVYLFKKKKNKIREDIHEVFKLIIKIIYLFI